jgi:hypothetical protein
VPDSIQEEMLTHSSSKLKKAILKLFNLVSRVGYFLDIWNQGFIKPIFKKIDKSTTVEASLLVVTSEMFSLA